MTLSQAIVYYLFAFVLTLAFIICGCLIGITLRKRKDAKLAADTVSDGVVNDNNDITEEK